MSPWSLKKASVWLCQQHNSVSFDQIFLKIAYKVDIDEISNDCETWPDRIINLRVTSPWFLKKCLTFSPACESCKVDISGISDKFETWPDCNNFQRVMSPWLLEKLILWSARIICLRGMPHWLLKKAHIWLFHQHNLFSFDWIMIRLTWMTSWTNSKTDVMEKRKKKKERKCYLF